MRCPISCRAGDSLTKPGDTVGILGLAYKPGTNVIEQSYALELARQLGVERRAVVGWDPLAMEEARREMGSSLVLAQTPEECLRSAKLVVIVNPMPELATIDWSVGDATVMDCWRSLPVEAVKQISCYLPLGNTHGDNRVPGLTNVGVFEHLGLLTN